MPPPLLPSERVTFFLAVRFPHSVPFLFVQLFLRAHTNETLFLGFGFSCELFRLTVMQKLPFCGMLKKENYTRLAKRFRGYIFLPFRFDPPPPLVKVVQHTKAVRFTSWKENLGKVDWNCWPGIRTTQLAERVLAHRGKLVEENLFFFFAKLSENWFLGIF